MNPESAPLRVLRVIARLNVGGPARHVVILDKGLRAKGHVTLLAFGDVAAGEASMESLADEAGLPRRRIAGLGPSVRPLDDLRALATLARLVFAVRPDVVHTHTAKAGLLGRLAAWLYNLTRPRGQRCLVVHTFHGHVLHGYFGPVQSAAVRWIERALALLTDGVLVLSPRLKEEICQRYRVARPSKIEIVPLGLELDELLGIAREYDVESGGSRPFVFGYVGRLVLVKNLPLLLAAFERVRAQTSNARLVIVGEGDHGSTLKQVVRTQGLEGHVRFAGWRSDLVDVYTGFDALVLSSVNEGTPVAVIEAMASGLPVVATSVGGVPDVVTHDETGLLVPTGDVEQFAAAMLHLARSVDERRRLGTRARESVRARFSVERLVSDVERLYARSLRRKRGALH